MTANGSRDRRAGFLILGLSVVAFVVFLFAIRGTVYRVPSGSMERTIPVGSHVLVNPYAYRRREPQRGDIVTHRYQNVSMMKRVIALPGETIEIRDKVVSINGKRLDEPYVLHLDPQVYPRLPALPEPYRSRDQFGPFVVPAGSYFVMGDNRDRSHDSRYWGALERQDITGKVWKVIR